MPVTQKDIAEKLNVSRSVVAGVLGNHASTRVRDETRSRILQAAAEMNYRPNRAATALRNSRTGIVTIAYVRPTEEWRPIYFGVSENLAETLAQVRSSLMIRVYPTQAECLEGLRILESEQGTDVVVLLGKPEDVVEQGELLESIGLSFVVLGRFESTHPDWLQIDFDHELMMRNAVEHLYRRGHTRIAYLGYQMDSPFCLHLRDGYINAMQQIVGSSLNEAYVGSVVPGFVMGSLPGQMARWWALPEAERPTAIVVGMSENVVWGGLEGDLAKRGLLLGDGPNKVAAAGLSGDNLALLYGEAYVYDRLGHTEYARLTAERLLVPLLRSEAIEHNVVLVAPRLSLVQAYNSNAA